MNWSSVKGLGGRFCNKVIINTCFSILSEKNNLYIDYDYTNECNDLGINLFCGTNKYNNTVFINDNNLIHSIELSEKQQIKSNIKSDGSYFQTKEISNYLFKYFNLPNISINIINKNKFNERYNNNNDIFIHIRLGDVTQFNPGYNYYVKAIESIKEYNNIYISSDSISHEICQKLIINYKAIPITYNEIDTIHYGSTCKNVIVSHGSFSAVIGYLSFFSNIYYSEYETGKIWYGDMFSIPFWNKVNL